MGDRTLTASPAARTHEERDYYDELLRQTRGLRREHALAREAWLARLTVERKVEHLFELEVLLKGVACFANPRNHPGPPRKTPVVAQDFREHTILVREAIGRILQSCRLLLAEGERAFVFQRYLETVLPEDRARTRWADDALAQDAPEHSLLALRHGLTNLVELMVGLTRLNRVPFRLFYALLRVAQRETTASTYFNPLHALEFRPEFDRITHPQMLELMRVVPGEQPRRLVALTVLSLFRMLRYLGLAESLVHESDGARRSGRLTYVVLSVMRSDARALSDYLRRRAGELLAQGYEADVLGVPAVDLSGSYKALLARGHILRDVKAALEGVAANLRLEFRRAFERDFPALDAAPTPDELRAAVQRTAGSLKPALQNAVMFVGSAMGARLDARGVFDDESARRTLSERLRRDVWMFSQIVRAFADKLRSTRPAGLDGWAGGSPLSFVREFLVYFRAMGYPLLRATDYPRFESFVREVEHVREEDLVDPFQLDALLRGAEEFHTFLNDLFQAVCRREELVDSPFDRRGAAIALKLYLGEGA